VVITEPPGLYCNGYLTQFRERLGVRGGLTAGSEQMWVRAFDGPDWSPWDPFTLTTHA
jgi:hypothetical protein